MKKYNTLGESEGTGLIRTRNKNKNKNSCLEAGENTSSFSESTCPWQVAKAIPRQKVSPTVLPEGKKREGVCTLSKETNSKIIVTGDFYISLSIMNKTR